MSKTLKWQKGREIFFSKHNLENIESLFLEKHSKFCSYKNSKMFFFVFPLIQESSRDQKFPPKKLFYIFSLNTQKKGKQF